MEQDISDFGAAGDSDSAQNPVWDSVTDSSATTEPVPGREKPLNDEKHIRELGSGAVVNSLSEGGTTQSQPKTKDAGNGSKQRRRGHPMKQVKAHLAEQGKLNAKPPMPASQRRARRRKKKK